jgi:hypothetical protein
MDCKISIADAICLLALVSRPTLTSSRWPRYPLHMGSSRVGRTDDVGCGRESVEMHGAENAKAELLPVGGDVD